MKPYIVVIPYYGVHLCFSTQELALCFPLLKSHNPVNHLNLHHVPSNLEIENIFYHKSYGDFHSSMHLASTIKQSLEMKKTTGEDYFYLLYCTLWYNNA